MRPGARLGWIAAGIGALVASWQACTNDFDALGVLAAGGAGSAGAGAGGQGRGGSSGSGAAAGSGGGTTTGTGGDTATGSGGATTTGTGGCGPGTAECDAAKSGCESLDSVYHCGECGNDCTVGHPRGWVCVSAAADCGCADNGDCGSMGSCDTRSGVCTCDDTECGPNEICKPDMSTSICVCDREVCAAGFVCEAGACACVNDGNCKHGGTCVGGVCHCGAAVCETGLACVADGECDS